MTSPGGRLTETTLEKWPATPSNSKARAEVTFRATVSIGSEAMRNPITGTGAEAAMVVLRPTPGAPLNDCHL